MDGELYLGRGGYQKLAEILLNKNRADRDWLAMTFVAFDAPQLNLPFKQRLEAMERVLSLSSSYFIKLIKFETCLGQEHMNQRLAELTEEGKEHYNQG